MVRYNIQDQREVMFSGIYLFFIFLIGIGFSEYSTARVVVPDTTKVKTETRINDISAIWEKEKR